MLSSPPVRLALLLCAAVLLLTAAAAADTPIPAPEQDPF
jgi:hypothetical protein